VDQKIWYVVVNGKAEGPFSEHEMKDRVHSGQTSPEDFVFKPGLPNWVPLKNCTELSILENANEPAAQVAPLAPKFEINQKLNEEPAVEKILAPMTPKPEMQTQNAEKICFGFGESNPEMASSGMAAQSPKSGRHLRLVVAGAAGILGMAVAASYIHAIRAQKEQSPEVPIAAIRSHVTVTEPLKPQTVVAQTKHLDKHLKLMPLKLASPHPQIAIEGSFTDGEEVTFEIHARPGNILKYPSYFAKKTVRVQAGQVPTIDLSSLHLPAGTYSAVAKTERQSAQSIKLSLGEQNSDFQKKLKAYQKEVAAVEKQDKTQLNQKLGLLKKQLTTVQTLYAKNKKSKQEWARGYKEWNKNMAELKKSLAQFDEKNRNKHAYPEQFMKLKAMAGELAQVAQAYDQNVKAGRGVASASDTRDLSKFLKALEKEIKSLK